MRLKSLTLMLALFASSTSIKAGGLLTNTNQSIAFLRSLARDGAIGIDGVYSNPAGVAFLPMGLHISFNVQNVYQTRTINSGMTVPALQGTPFYQPFRLNGGNDKGIKEFKGKASVPILPSFQIAKNYEKWGFQMGFGIVGGGGKATFNAGLPTFERQIALIPALLAKQGFGSATPAYSVSSYIHGQQYDFGLQLGATYKVNDKLAVYGGARFNYIYNKYEGNIIGISANINGQMENLYDYFGSKANALTQLAIQSRQMADQATNPADKARYEGAAKQYQAGADKLNKTRENFADKY